MAFETCDQTKLQAFQYKIINIIFPCNHTLSIWYKEISSLCSYCRDFEDNLEHYFYACDKVTLFWTRFSKWWKNVYGFAFQLSTLDILFGVLNENNDIIIVNFNYCTL